MVLKMIFFIFLLCVTGSLTYDSLDEHMMNELNQRIMLFDNIKRVVKNLDGVNYFDVVDILYPEESVHDMEEDGLVDYDGLAEDGRHPSIRDQEYLQHSTLWGKQLLSGGAGEGNQLLRPQGIKNKQQIKTDSTLPAYCNPPNPCPVDYIEEQGCIQNFENSASYSRRYQGLQDCMCDTEHMFDCPNPNASMVDDMDPMDDIEFNTLLQQSMKMSQLFPHKNLVAKKFHPNEKSKRVNPFLTGEKLPVAAKKGNNVLF